MEDTPSRRAQHTDVGEWLRAAASDWRWMLPVLCASAALATYRVEQLFGESERAPTIVSSSIDPVSAAPVAPVVPPRPAEAAPRVDLRFTGAAVSVAQAPASAWDLPYTRAEAVDHWVGVLSTSRRGEMQRWLERMPRYEPLIRGALGERGMPGDLIYLVLIESGVSNTARSRVGATGMWQFMGATAEEVGLEVSPYVDERRDPVRATYAAVRHLRGLHERLGSWYLAAAAYNAGERRVGDILRRRTGRDRGDEASYWVIRPWLPRETQNYVPLLLAAARIAKDPAAFGFEVSTAEPPLAYAQVAVPATPSGVSLSVIASVVGTEPDRLYELNPHLVRRSTPPGRRWAVRVPPEVGARLAAPGGEPGRTGR